MAIRRQLVSEPHISVQQSFWHFSLAVYAKPDVAEECLALQEEFGLDVNLLLFSVYMGAVRGVILSEQDVEHAIDIVAVWHRDVVKRLRGVRQSLKVLAKEQAAPTAKDIEKYRATIKAAELEAERFEHKWLEDWSHSVRFHAPSGSPSAAAAANVATLFAISSASRQPPRLPNHLIAAALRIGRPSDETGA
jgi:uncharacterized protein (TIGR02444 family)